MYSSNFTVDNKIFCLSLHHHDDNSYLFVNGKEVTKLKVKNSLCLGDLSKDYNTNVHHKKTTGLYANLYYFSVDYSALFQMIKYMIFMPT